MKKRNFDPIARNTNIALVTKEMIDNRALRTSSSEMLVLFNNFAFIVGKDPNGKFTVNYVK